MSFLKSRSAIIDSALAYSRQSPRLSESRKLAIAISLSYKAIALFWEREIISFPFDWELYHPKCCRGGFANHNRQKQPISKTRPTQRTIIIHIVIFDANFWLMWAIGRVRRVFEIVGYRYILLVNPPLQPFDHRRRCEFLPAFAMTQGFSLPIS